MISLTLATQLLVQGLQRVCDPSQLCCYGNPTLLQWAFSQPPLQSTVAKAWVCICVESYAIRGALLCIQLLQWLQSAAPDVSKLMRVLMKSQASLQCLLVCSEHTTKPSIKNPAPSSLPLPSPQEKGTVMSMCACALILVYQYDLILACWYAIGYRWVVYADL